MAICCALNSIISISAIGIFLIHDRCELNFTAHNIYDAYKCATVVPNERGTCHEAVKPFQPSGMQDASKTIALGCTAHVNVNFFLYGM